MNVTVSNKLPQYSSKVNNALEDALREGGRDIQTLVQTRAPYRKGDLRGQKDARWAGRLLWRVSYWMEYARYQEFGGDGRRTVRKYTTAGTGKHFLSRSGKDVAHTMDEIIKKHIRRIQI